MSDIPIPQTRRDWPTLLWGLAGAVCGAAGLICCLGLDQGGWLDHLGMAALLAVWMLAALMILRWVKLKPNDLILCLLPLGVAALLRALSLDHVSSDYTYFLARWTDFFRTHGGFAALGQPVGNYNVPYLYFLSLISYLPAPDLYLIKFFSIFFDLLLAYAGLRLARKLHPESDRPAVIAFSVLLLLPTVVLNGAYWGQCDSIYGALTLLALLDALDDHPARSVVWLGLAFSFKLQTVFLIPLWCILWYSGRVKFKHLLLFPAVNVLISLPAMLLGKTVKDILSIYWGQTTIYNDYLTLNAPSVFSMFFNKSELDVAFWSKVGILAAFGFVFALLIWLFFFRKRLTDEQLLLAGLLLAVGVPFLLPHMHDRYFFLADVLAVTWAAGNWNRFPVPAAVQLASLTGYHAYLAQCGASPIGFGSLFLLLVLVALLLCLGGSLRENGRRLQ